MSLSRSIALLNVVVGGMLYAFSSSGVFGSFGATFLVIQLANIMLSVLWVEKDELARD
jgi:hypothetical protein